MWEAYKKEKKKKKLTNYGIQKTDGIGNHNLIWDCQYRFTRTGPGSNCMIASKMIQIRKVQIGETQITVILFLFGSENKIPIRRLKLDIKT